MNSSALLHKTAHKQKCKQNMTSLKQTTWTQRVKPVEVNPGNAVATIASCVTFINVPGCLSVYVLYVLLSVIRTTADKPVNCTKGI